MSTISERSYVVREGKFQDGNALIQGWLDYDPANPLIKKPALATFISGVQAANLLVVTTTQTITSLRDQRRAITFAFKTGSDVNCLENRIKNILQYIAGDLPGKKSAISAIKTIIRKIRPHYPKKVKTDPPQPRGAGKSPSERSFNALVGYGKEVIGIITQIGPDYAPTNTNIELAAFTAFVGTIDSLNIHIASALEAYSDAVRDRINIYDGIDGMADRIVMIKNYLAGFEGGKKSAHYLDFVQALK